MIELADALLDMETDAAEQKNTSTLAPPIGLTRPSRSVFLLGGWVLNV